MVPQSYRDMNANEEVHRIS